MFFSKKYALTCTFHFFFVPLRPNLDFMNFTHLHVHSHYSLLDGLSKVEDIVDKCLSTGMNSALSSLKGLCKLMAR